MKTIFGRFAFTMIELVFVIIVIGILSALAIPRFDRNNLREAADQVLVHIRYTQHLAMQDNKFNPNDANWYLGRWQIRFSTANGTRSYFIMSDTMFSSYDANPNAPADFSYSEVARDPLNRNLYLIGTTYSSFDGDRADHINKKLDLLESYGITNISITGGNTGSSSRRIIFDNMGRPYRGDTKLSNANVIKNSTDRIATSAIRIILSNNIGSRTIRIAPETGYTRIE